MKTTSFLAATLRFFAGFSVATLLRQLGLYAQNAIGDGIVFFVPTAPALFVSALTCGALFVYAPELASFIVGTSRSRVAIGIRFAVVLFATMNIGTIVDGAWVWSNVRFDDADGNRMLSMIRGTVHAARAGVAVLVTAAILFVSAESIGGAIDGKAQEMNA